MPSGTCTTDHPARDPFADVDPHRRNVPLLVYDGDCGFCAFWAGRWQRMAGEHVAFAPYQAVACHFPGISEDAFRGAVQFVAVDGSIASGAEACYRVLDHVPGERHWLWLYRHVPGFSALSEAAYRAVALRRPLFARLSRWLWGPGAEPVRYELTASLFLRLLGLVYCAAFVSLGVQVPGLIGSEGLLPASAVFHAGGGQALLRSWLGAPSVFWIDAGDGFLLGACWAGAAASVAVILGRLVGPAVLACWVLYLSLYHAGQIFMNYQWDLLLLESGFLGWLLTWRSRIPLYLLRWLLFRFMFLSGAVKLASGDPSWSSLRALRYHLETQPLPTPLAWYAHQLPDTLLASATAAHFVIELMLPFLVFLPRRPRFVAAAGFLLLQLAIIASGNYGFFNLLTLVLLIPLLDDQLLKRFVPGAGIPSLARTPRLRPGWRSGLLAVFAAFAVIAGGAQMSRRLALEPDTAVIAALEPFHLVNAYGVFAYLLRDRREIIFEFSEDGASWNELEFPWKPGPPGRAPRWSIPHQPRLDWQLWFAALGDVRDNAWTVSFVERILAGSPDVMSLLKRSAGTPNAPRMVRATLYRYRFATPDEHRAGRWWVREPEREYLPPVTRETVGRVLRGNAPPESFIRWR